MPRESVEPRRRAPLALLLALTVIVGVLGSATARDIGDTGGVKGAPRAASPGHGATSNLKIRTPRQCFRYCRGTLGASVDFCAVSCYR